MLVFIDIHQHFIFFLSHQIQIVLLNVIKYFCLNWFKKKMIDSHLKRISFFEIEFDQFLIRLDFDCCAHVLYHFPTLETIIY